MSRRRARPLHLLEFGLHWPPETFVHRKLERLAAAGMRITVAVAAPPPRGTPIPGIEIVQAVPGDRPRRASLRGAWSALCIAVRRPARLPVLFRAAHGATGAGCRPRRLEAIARFLAYARLHGRRPDVLHFEWLSAAVNHVSLIDALGCPAVVSCSGEQSLYGRTPSTARLTGGVATAFARASAVHCVADAVMREALAHDLDPAKVCLIRAGVDIELFRPPAAPRPAGDGFSVVSVGWLRWLKGHEYALMAVAELAREGIPVTLDILGGDPHSEIGEHSERRRILRAVADLGLAGRVRLHGHVDPAAVAARMRRADGLLHMGLSEGLPTVVVEAMACGLPVVATDVAGTGEAIRHGVEGFLIPPRDPRAAATALRALWADRHMRDRMGRAGRARAAAEFTIERQTGEWLERYGQLAGGAA